MHACNAKMTPKPTIKVTILYYECTQFFKVRKCTQNYKNFLRYCFGGSLVITSCTSRVLATTVL